MPEIKFLCNHCGQPIVCDESAAETKFPCPACKLGLTVPTTTSEKDAFPSVESRDVFLSYRREGGENLARLVMTGLVQMGYTVFMDTESLKQGKFDSAILQHIELATDVVVICSPNALARCVNQDDWVRQEILHAFRHGKNIIRLMDRNFHMPLKDELPKDIAELVETERLSAPASGIDAATIEFLANEFLHSDPNPALRQIDELSAEGRLLAWNNLRAMIAGGIALIVLLIALVSVPSSWNHTLNSRFHRLGEISKETVCANIICTLAILLGARLSHLSNRLGPWLVLVGSEALVVTNLVLCYYHFKALKPFFQIFHNSPTPYYFQWGITIVPFMVLVFLYRKGK